MSSPLSSSAQPNCALLHEQVLFLHLLGNSKPRRKIDRKAGSFAWGSMHVQSAMRLLEQTVHDTKAKSCPVALAFSCEVWLEDLGKDLRRHPRAVVRHSNRNQRRGIFETFPVHKPVFLIVLKFFRNQRFLADLGSDLHPVRLSGAL